MGHKNKIPVESNGDKFKLNFCSFLESPLHCWPLTLFYDQEVTHKNGNSKGKVNGIIKSKAHVKITTEKTRI